MLIITENNVAEIVKMDELIPIIENALIEFSRGGSIQPATKGIDLGEDIGNLELFTACLTTEKIMAVKILNARKNNPKNGHPLIYADINLINYKTGETLAVIEGGSVTALRTAAASAVATKYLSRKDSRNLALIGTGRQGRTHLNSLLNVRSIRKLFIYDIDKKSAERFKAENRYDIEIIITDTVKEAVKHADIIQICTTTIEPVVLGSWVRAGTHINSIASYSPNVREIDTDLILRAKAVSDSRIKALEGGGEFVIPIKEGLMDEAHLYAEIGEIAGGYKKGRDNEQEITFFKSMGLAVEDVSSANYIYNKAKAENIGIEINYNK